MESRSTSDEIPLYIYDIRDKKRVNYLSSQVNKVSIHFKNNVSVGDGQIALF